MAASSSKSEEEFLDNAVATANETGCLMSLHEWSTEEGSSSVQESQPESQPEEEREDEEDGDGESEDGDGDEGENGDEGESRDDGEAIEEEEDEDESKDTLDDSGGQGDEDEDGDDSSEDDSDNSDIPEPTPTKRRRPQPAPRRKRGKVQPESDNVPDPPSVYQPDYPCDEDGWTRTLHNISIEAFRGKTPHGACFRRSDSPLNYFLHFFPLSLLLSIVAWTNVRLKKPRKVLTNIREIRAWFGVHVLMGVVKVNNYRLYWSTHPALHNTAISTTMTRNRFDTLNEYLACNDPQKDPELIKDKAERYCTKKKHPLYLLQPIWDKVRDQCLHQYNAARELTVDEAMIKYRGFKSCVRKFFMPLKPIRAGFKVYVLAESSTGTTLNFMVHPHGDKPSKMADITMKVTKHHLGRYHHLYTDKLYTSVNLANLLLQKSTYLTGAVKSNSKGLPKDLLTTSANPDRQRAANAKKVPRGTFYIRQNGSIIAAMWKDSWVMMTLSTGHQGWRDPLHHTVKKKIPHPDTGRLIKSDIPAPPQAIDYTRYMGGVDRGDQLRSYHTCSRKSQFWWKKLLYFRIDIARVNAWIAFKQHHCPEDEDDDEEEDVSSSTKTMSHTSFIVQLGT
ncbi:piggyBac transposable element-derived protein 3-like [Asterias rubens]|uniref:piggyBac transposable element-derived protein 3-like n=1 Tax=Asterias rubens TaxID=7604 RepID=UPI0014553BDC|nr:piggyBac transposable element-derived protein 3-like [Asterias rubens]